MHSVLGRMSAIPGKTRRQSALTLCIRVIGSSYTHVGRVKEGRRLQKSVYVGHVSIGKALDCSETAEVSYDAQTQLFE